MPQRRGRGRGRAAAADISPGAARPAVVVRSHGHGDAAAVGAAAAVGVAGLRRRLPLVRAGAGPAHHARPGAAPPQDGAGRVQRAAGGAQRGHAVQERLPLRGPALRPDVPARAATAARRHGRLAGARLRAGGGARRSLPSINATAGFGRYCVHSAGQENKTSHFLASLPSLQRNFVRLDNFKDRYWRYGNPPSGQHQQLRARHHVLVLPALALRVPARSIVQEVHHAAANSPVRAGGALPAASYNAQRL